MGYGAGGFLLVVGLILALAVDATVSGVDLQLVGWIMAVVGLGLLVLTAVTLNSSRRTGTVQRTTHSDGSQTTTERRSKDDPPAV